VLNTLFFITGRRGYRLVLASRPAQLVPGATGAPTRCVLPTTPIIPNHSHYASHCHHYCHCHAPLLALAAGCWPLLATGHSGHWHCLVWCVVLCLCFVVGLLLGLFNLVVGCWVLGCWGRNGI
jgi:hypothetical protein